MTTYEEIYGEIKFCPNCGSDVAMRHMSDGFDHMTGTQKFYGYPVCTGNKRRWLGRIFMNQACLDAMIVLQNYLVDIPNDQ